jgi:hypothetical protein
MEQDELDNPKNLDTLVDDAALKSIPLPQLELAKQTYHNVRGIHSVIGIDDFVNSWLSISDDYFDQIANQQKTHSRQFQLRSLCTRIAAETVQMGHDIKMITTEVIDRACYCGKPRLDHVQEDGTHITKEKGQEKVEIPPDKLDEGTKAMRALWQENSIELQVMLTAEDGDFEALLECNRTLRLIVKDLVT